MTFPIGDAEEVELVAVDLPVARAYFEGVPTSRLLARIRLDRDLHDLVDATDRASGVDFETSSWDATLGSLVGSSPNAVERVKRAVTRHTRTADDEGRLVASDAAIAALVIALLSSDADDASPREGAAEGVLVDESICLACAALDDRLGSRSADRRAPPFEACLQLARLGSVRTMGLKELRELCGDGLFPAEAPLYPKGETEVPLGERRAWAIVREDLERGLVRSGAAIDLPRRGELLIWSIRAPRTPAPAPPSSWLPSDFSTEGAAQRLAFALEQGATTPARVRQLVARGGEGALDAIGREMLAVDAHPAASALFAEVLAQAARDRDVVRLVGYFAIAPDPIVAARVLACGTAPELGNVLRGWLETMPAERVATVLTALAPHPHLFAAVRTLRSGR